MELTISKEKLKRFLDLLSLSGENQINESLIEIKKDSISSLTKSPTNNLGVSISLKGKFNEIGEIGIDDLSLLKNSLNIQDKDEIVLKIKENKIVISSGKTKASLLIRKSDYIKNKPKEEDFNKYITAASGNEMIITQEDIIKILKAYNLIKSETINMIGEEKSVKFVFNKMDNEIETEILLADKITPFKTTITPYLLFLISLIGEEVLISTKQDSPIILVSYKKDDFEVKYVLSSYGK